MERQVQGAGVALACEVQGAGPPVLLVHGLGDAREGWRETAAALAGEATVITYDRRGYGASEAPEPYERTTVEEQAEDAAAVLAACASGPAVVCGEDFGALVCLDLAQRHGDRLAGAVVIDPPLHAFVAGAAERLATERVLIEARLRDEGPPAAAAALLAAEGHGPERQARGAANHRALFADWGGQPAWDYGRRGLRALDLPLRVLSSSHAGPHERAAADTLAGLAPQAVRWDGAAADAIRDLLGAAAVTRRA
ncbi:MAG: alpha/beta fold hydrolase [Solirubrobacteraceae bacterium]